MDIKFFLAIASTVLLVIAYFPYIRDIFRGETKPHAYTWLVWAITQGTATVGVWYGGGKFSTISLAAGTLLVVLIFFFSLKYGTKNITKSDTIVLLLALLAIVVWWQLQNPLIAVFMVTAIDALGYIPTFRKSFKEPWSETISFWFMVMTVTILSLLANAEYNLLTTLYLATLAVLNFIVAVLCIYRRKTIPKPITYAK